VEFIIKKVERRVPTTALVIHGPLGRAAAAALLSWLKLKLDVPEVVCFPMVPSLLT
jgi:hypothetical protein